MSGTRRIQQTFSIAIEFPVFFTRAVFDLKNETLCSVFPPVTDAAHKILLVLDSGVQATHPDLVEQIQQYAHAHKDVMTLVGQPLFVRGGEICKSDPVEVDKILSLVEQHAICRHSFILCIGGGSVLDAVGYAASIAHRGVRLIRMPSTVLAQNDAGIGVKTAINFHARKNFVGTFSAPHAVINDFDLLRTLDPRDKRAGIAEAIKIALIKQPALFDYLEQHSTALHEFSEAEMEEMIVRCAQLHLNHIAHGGDPFETGSARPLDFGHWSAHKLEEISGHQLRHGEAVAIGIAIDTHYSARMGYLSTKAMARIIALIKATGFELNDTCTQQLDIPKALADFREHLGGQLSIPMLSDIGTSFEVHEINVEVMQQVVSALANL